MTITWEQLNSDQRGMLRAALRRNVFTARDDIPNEDLADGLERMHLLEIQHISSNRNREYAITEDGRALVEANPLTQESHGLYRKYIVTKAATGKGVDGCFVLRPDRDEHAGAALLAYAKSCEFDNPVLHAELLAWLDYIAR